jgi:serine/threonine protein kinase
VAAVHAIVRIVSKRARAGFDAEASTTLEEVMVAVRPSAFPPVPDDPRDLSGASSSDATGPDPRRYELRELIGQGSTSVVYAAFDRDLAREVAIKVVRVPGRVERARSLREGRVMASLAHPNILPIYDVGSARDAIYFTMPRFTGRSLGALIRAAVSERRSQALPIATLVEHALKLCDALAYAHARGVIHRDIKPDNTMIGNYGEVMLVDWGAATTTHSESSSAPRMIGTPAYMSPEQVRGEAPTACSDVYALGATLFHALLLRRPLRETDAATFWQRKLAGDFDPASPDELARVPRALLGIAIKAMSLEPEARYGSAAELADALRDFLAGRSAWAAPSVREHFVDDGYLDRWTPAASSDFVRVDGRLVSRAKRGSLLIHKQRLAAGVAIEFDGEILAHAPPGDLSVLWTEEDLLEGGPHWPTTSSAITLQVGAFANLLAGIYRGFDRCLSGRSLSIELGRRYRIRAEINEQSLRLSLDGELVAEYETLFPIRSGHLALYGYYPGKAFSNVVIYERGLAERVSPTAIGDAFFARGDHDPAALQYLRTEQLLPHTKVAEEARYKRGLCRLMSGAAAAAEEVWSGLEDASWRARASLHSIDAAFGAGRHDEVLAELRRLLRGAPELAGTIINRWTEYVNRLYTSDSAMLASYIALRNEEFPHHLESAAAAAAAEIAGGNFRRVLEAFPEQHVQVVHALNLLGQFETVVERYACAPWILEMALVRLGHFDDPRITSETRGLVHLLRGDPEASLAESERAEALLVLGRYERVLALEHAEPEETAMALRGVGRAEEALARRDARSLALAGAGEDALAHLRLRERVFLGQHLALQSFVRGDDAAYLRHRDAVQRLPCAAIWPDVWVARYLLLPLADEMRGERGAFSASLKQALHERRTHWYGKLYHLARYVLGESSEAEFMAQPCRLYAATRLGFANALRAELLGDIEAARRAYRAYLSLPELERHLDSPLGNPLVDRWAAFRAGTI